MSSSSPRRQQNDDGVLTTTTTERDVKPTNVELMLGTLVYEIEEMKRSYEVSFEALKAAISAKERVKRSSDTSPSPPPAAGAERTPSPSKIRSDVLEERVDALKTELERERTARLMLERTIANAAEKERKKSEGVEAFRFDARSLLKVYGAALVGGPFGWHHYLRGDHALTLGYCMTCGGLGMGVALDLVTLPFQTHRGFLGRAIRWIQTLVVIDTAVFTFQFYARQYVIPAIAMMSLMNGGGGGFPETTSTGWSFDHVLTDVVTSPRFLNLFDWNEMSLGVGLVAAVVLNEVRAIVAFPIWVLYLNTRGDAKRDLPYSVIALALGIGRVLEYFFGFQALSLKNKYVRTMERNRRVESWMIFTAILLVLNVYFARFDVSQAYVERFIRDLESFTKRFENVTTDEI